MALASFFIIIACTSVNSFIVLLLYMCSYTISLGMVSETDKIHRKRRDCLSMKQAKTPSDRTFLKFSLGMVSSDMNISSFSNEPIDRNEAF